MTREDVRDTLLTLLVLLVLLGIGALAMDTPSKVPSLDEMPAANT